MNSPIKIEDLFITQESFRNVSQITGLTEFVSRGGRYTTFPCQINQTEDLNLWISDGHHRVYSCWAARKKVLHPCEYQLTNYTYQQFLEINLDVFWHTPFYLKTEVRKHELKDFRENVSRLVDKKELVRYILDNRGEYCQMRTKNRIFEITI